MKKVDNKIEDIFNYIKQINGNSPDITTRIVKIDKKRVGYIFLQSVSSDDKISDFLVKSLNLDYKFDTTNFFTNLFTNLQNSISGIATANSLDRNETAGRTGIDPGSRPDMRFL